MAHSPTNNNRIAQKLKRTNSDTLDAVLGDEYPLLDYGFIRVVDYMGGETKTLQSARVSYGAGTKSVSSDKDLLRYLYRHQHLSPFEQSTISLHVKAPIFVLRQLFRHRTLSINEVSARYSKLPQEFYIPEVENIKMQSKSNMQGRDEGSEVQFSHDTKLSLQESMTSVGEAAFELYQDYLDANLARELARTVLPVSAYSEAYLTVSLRGLLDIIRLRLDNGAQYEIRVYAEQLLEFVKLWCPNIHQAFMDYTLNSMTFSAQETQVLASLLSGNGIPDDVDLTKRESEVFAEKLLLLLDDIDLGDDSDE